MIEFEEEGHIYTVDSQRWPSVTQVLSDMGLVKPYLGDPWFGMRGTALHSASVLWDSGTLDPESVDPAISGFLDAYAKFRTETHMEWEYTEKRLKHSTYRFCGCIDRALPLCDLKTTDSACELQLAGYQSLLREEGIDPGREGFFLHLRENGTYKLVPYRFNRSDTGIFHAAVSLWHWRREKGLL